MTVADPTFLKGRRDRRRTYLTTFWSHRSPKCLICSLPNSIIQSYGSGIIYSLTKNSVVPIISISMVPIWKAIRQWLHRRQAAMYRCLKKMQLCRYRGGGAAASPASPGSATGLCYRVFSMFANSIISASEAVLHDVNVPHNACVFSSIHKYRCIYGSVRLVTFVSWCSTGQHRASTYFAVCDVAQRTCQKTDNIT